MAPGLGKGRKQGGDGISTGLSLEMERVKMEMGSVKMEMERVKLEMEMERVKMEMERVKLEMERVKRVEFAKECQESENDKQPQDPPYFINFLFVPLKYSTYIEAYIHC